MPRKKSTFELAYVAKFGKNIGTDDNPKWINYRVGAAFLDSKTGFLRLTLNLMVPQSDDGTWKLTLMPPLEDDDKPSKYRKKRK